MGEGGWEFEVDFRLVADSRISEEEVFETFNKEEKNEKIV
jgi:hypothetical protein